MLNLLLGARGAVTWRNRYGREETAIPAATANPPARTSRGDDAEARERRAFLSREWITPRRRRADLGRRQRQRPRGRHSVRTRRRRPRHRLSRRTRRCGGDAAPGGGGRPPQHYLGGRHRRREILPRSDHACCVCFWLF